MSHRSDRTAITSMHRSRTTLHGACDFWPTGTVYGTLLNFRGELQALGDRLEQAPHNGAPRAPVLYIKTANTWSASGSGIVLPPHVPQVEVGASVAMVMGERSFAPCAAAAGPCVAGYVLVNDLSIPQSSLFRPPVRYKCLDGFLGLGAQCVPPGAAGDPGRFVLEVFINGVLRQTLRFAELVRNAAQLIEAVETFMALRAGDLLLLGCDTGRPLARAGDQITISSPGLDAFGCLSNTLVPGSAWTAP